MNHPVTVPLQYLSSHGPLLRKGSVALGRSSSSGSSGDIPAATQQHHSYHRHRSMMSSIHGLKGGRTKSYSSGITKLVVLHRCGWCLCTRHIHEQYTQPADLMKRFEFLPSPSTATFAALSNSYDY
eukprot:g23110.t1